MSSKHLSTYVGVITALLVLFVPTLAAEAKPFHHRHHHVHARHHADTHARPVAATNGWLLGGFGSSLVAEARSQIGNGAIYGRANLWCARFVNFVLKATGHTGTGSDAAASFASYGRKISGPQVGAIAVLHRKGGGHVGIVSGVDGAGNPILISGNNGNRVREAAYPKGRIYAYVLPG